MGFSEILRELRTDRLLTHAQLGKKVGFGHSIIGYWESGKKRPTADALMALANFFDVSTDYLLGLSDHYRPATPIATPAPATARDKKEQEILNELTGIDEPELNHILGYIRGFKQTTNFKRKTKE